MTARANEEASKQPYEAEYRGQRILVTGGAGFIGSHLVSKLVTLGADVTVVDSLSTGRESNLRAVRHAIELRKMDMNVDGIQPLIAQGRFSVVFHLAGNAHVTRSVEEPALDYERNVHATFHLLEALRTAAPTTKVVFSSFAVVYGEGAHVPIRESHPTAPVSPYGVGKLACEHYIRVYSELYGLRAASARLFSIYGPRLRKQIVYDLMCKLRSNSDVLPMFGDGTQVRDMSHVQNAADAMLIIAARGKLNGECYNAASGEQVTMREVAVAICREMGVDPVFQYSGQVRPGETQAWYPDYTALRDLGYETRIGLQQGLADTVAWFKAQPD